MDTLPASLSASQVIPFFGGTSKSTIYTSIRNNTFPTRLLRINNRIVIPTRPLIEAMGMTPEEALEVLNQQPKEAA